MMVKAALTQGLFRPVLLQMRTKWLFESLSKALLQLGGAGRKADQAFGMLLPLEFSFWHNAKRVHFFAIAFALLQRKALSRDSKEHF